MKISITCLVTAFALTLLAGIAHAGDGDMKIVLKDKDGIRVNATAKAKKGDLVDSCVTTAGSCTLKDLPAGTYAVSAKSSNNCLVTKTVAHPTVKSGKTVTVTLLMLENESCDGGSKAVIRSGVRAGSQKSCFFPCKCVCPEAADDAVSPGDMKAPSGQKPIRIIAD